MPLSSQAVRQSAAELLACAITQLFPNVQLLCSQTTEISFSYDFIVEQSFDDTLLPLIEEKMRELSKENIEIQRMDMMRENAADFFRHRRQFLKAEAVLLDVHNVIPVFKMGEFYDYCPLPYAENSGEVRAFKLQKLEETVTNTPTAGQVRVARITGAAFSNSMDLKKFLKLFEKAKKKDHRLLGEEMGLFHLSETEGLDALWCPKGAVLREIFLNWWRSEHASQGYQIVATPHVLKSSFLKKLGFLENNEARSSLFPDFEVDEFSYVLAPTVKPAHAALFLSKTPFSQELPVRYAESAEIYHNTKRSQLWGVLQGRLQTVDSAHTFCQPAEVLHELISSLHFIEKNVKMLGLECCWCLVSKRQKSANNFSHWKEGVKWLTQALTECGIPFAEDNEMKALDGPRVEVRLIDAFGRKWCGPQLEIDFNLPERLGLCYRGQNNTMHAPWMIARSMFGSIERFIAIAIEQFAGQFPLWLAPEQVRIIPLGEKQHSYAVSIKERLKMHAMRCSVDYRSDSLGAKIHTAERENIPYVIIVGEQEEKKEKITVRSCSKQGKTCHMQLDNFLDVVQKEVNDRSSPRAKQNVEEE